MTPEALARLTEFALPLFLRWRKTAATDPHIRSLGTGWLLEFRDDLLLVSAAHVLKEVGQGDTQEDDLVLFRGPYAKQDPIPVSGTSYLSNEQFDVGFVRLESDVAAQLRNFARVRLDALSLKPEAEIERRAVVGWPQELRPATPTMQGNMKVYSGRAFTACGDTYSTEDGPDEGDFIYMPIDANRQAAGALPSSLKGISGAPVWAWRSDAWRVIGVETDVVPRAHLRFIRATPIHQLLGLIDSVTKG